MNMQAPARRQNAEGTRVLPGSGPAPLILGALLLVLGACGSAGSGSIPCESEADCPGALTCDLERGVCVGEDDEPYDCNPPLPGCPCSGGSTISCTAPGQDPGVVASCRRGESTCVEGRYESCRAVENPNCTGVDVGPDDFNPNDENSSQVDIGPGGGLVLDPDVQRVDFGYLWVANTGENTVSKIDIDTGEEVARYAAVRGSSGLGVPGVPIGGYNGSHSNCGNCPSRTAIDYNGDAFVANRAFDRQGTVTKYANRIDDCIDRNGNGMIETSTDVNGDGIIDVDDPDEFLGENDECILWTVTVGGPGGVPRGLAIDAGGPDGANGNLWVGLWTERRVVQLSGETGQPILIGGSPVSIATPEIRPYGNAADGLGNIWVTGLIENNSHNTSSVVYLAQINGLAGTLTEMHPVPDDPSGCSLGYGIAIDTKQRVWLGGWDCQDIKVFDPVAGEWYRRSFPGDTSTRGIAVDADDNVWVAFTGSQSEPSRVGRLRMDDVVTLGNSAPVTYFDMPALLGFESNNTIGVGIDRNGACWAVSLNNGSDVGAATRIDTADVVEAFPVGRHPYTYSDFTGFGLATVVRPNGFWRGIIEGCLGDQLTQWGSLNWEATTPPGTSVRLRIRVANAVADLVGATWFGPWETPPVDLAAAGVPDARFMQVEVQLSTDEPTVSPSFHGFSVGFVCPDDFGPIN